MGTLIYATNVSLDGFTEDTAGSFDWAEPDPVVHQHYNDLLRGVGVQLLGRKMYETMAVWETDPSLAENPIGADFAAVWQDSDKIVYSRTLAEPFTERTSMEKRFEPDEVRELKASASTDLTISGPELAAVGLRAGVVDEVHVIVSPVTLGAGKPAFPLDHRLHLELLDEHRFELGSVHLRYRVRT